jgi:hypothetical protein
MKLMSVNIGALDRALRAVLGAALIVLAFGNFLPVLSVGAAKWIVAAAGVILLATAALRLCPLYALFGIRTCRT